MAAGAYRQEDCGALMGLNGHAEDVLIEGRRALSIRNAEGEVAEIAYREQPFGRCGLGRLTHIAQRAGSSTIPDILELNVDTIGIT